MPGPPRKKNARRRNLGPDWLTLPFEGRAGDPPDFPIGKGTKAVLALWVDLWKSPQAVMWEDLGWTRIVARYAKLVIASEVSTAPTSLLAEVRQLEDRLGLTPMAMKRLQWEIDEPAAADQPDAEDGGQAENVTSMESYRERLG